MAERPRVKMPNEAKLGEIIVIKTLIAHPMESGLRKDASGALIPRRILNRFVCRFNGNEVFACDFEPSVAANPFLQFSARVEGGGVYTFAWTDDDGTVLTAEQPMKLVG